MPIENTPTVTPNIANGGVQRSSRSLYNDIRVAAAARGSNVGTLLGEYDASNDNERLALGQVILGDPALANDFISALINATAMKRIESLNFHNPFTILKKGTVEYGANITHSHVSLLKPDNYSQSPYDGNGRLKEKTRADAEVDVVTYVPNAHLQYALTIHEDELAKAFTSPDGLSDLVSVMVSRLEESNNYEDYQVSSYIIATTLRTGNTPLIGITAGDTKELAIQLRSLQAKWAIPSTKYNPGSGNGPRLVAAKPEDFVIVMTADSVARYDVELLSSVFNMDKATFDGHLITVSNFGELDHGFFANVSGPGGEKFMTAFDSAMVAYFDKVEAFVTTKDFFQFYDRKARHTKSEDASTFIGKHFRTQEKVWGISPFAPRVAIVDKTVLSVAPTTIDVEVTGKWTTSNGQRILSFVPDIENVNTFDGTLQWVETDEAIAGKILVNRQLVTFGGTTDTFDLTIELAGATFAATITDASTGTITLTAV